MRHWVWEDDYQDEEYILAGTVGSATALSEEPEEPILYGPDDKPIMLTRPFGFRVRP